MRRRNGNSKVRGLVESAVGRKWDYGGNWEGLWRRYSRFHSDRRRRYPVSAHCLLLRRSQHGWQRRAVPLQRKPTPIAVPLHFCQYFRTNKREVQRCFSVCIVQRPSEILRGISSATDRWRRCISWVSGRRRLASWVETHPARLAVLRHTYTVLSSSRLAYT